MAGGRHDRLYFFREGLTVADLSEGFKPVVIRDASLAHKLMGGPGRAKAGGTIPIQVPGAGPGGTVLLAHWPIDGKAWDQVGQGEIRKPPDKEAA